MIPGERFDEDTLWKVYNSLRDLGFTKEQTCDAINMMQNAGILFRERSDV